MAYATLAQIRTAAGGADRLVQLADQDKDGVADADVIAQAQAEVDAVIDSYCKVRYSVPLQAPSAALQSVSAGEVVYWLRDKRPNALTETDHRNHVERLDWLAKVSKGQVVPVDADGAMPAASSQQRSAWVERDTPFSGKGGPF